MQSRRYMRFLFGLNVLTSRCEDCARFSKHPTAKQVRTAPLPTSSGAAMRNVIHTTFTTEMPLNPRLHAHLIYLLKNLLVCVTFQRRHTQACQCSLIKNIP